MRKKRLFIIVGIFLMFFIGFIFRKNIIYMITMDYENYQIISSKENFDEYLSEKYNSNITVLDMITVDKGYSSIEVQYIGVMNTNMNYIGREYVPKRNKNESVIGDNRQITPNKIKHATYLTSKYHGDVLKIFEGYLTAFYAYPIDTWEDLESYFPNTKFSEKMKFYLIIDGDLESEEVKNKIISFEEYIEYNENNSKTGYRMVDYVLASTEKCTDIINLFWSSYDTDEYFHTYGESEYTSKDLMNIK